MCPFLRDATFRGPPSLPEPNLSVHDPSAAETAGPTSPRCPINPRSQCSVVARPRQSNDTSHIVMEAALREPGCIVFCAYCLKALRHDSKRNHRSGVRGFCVASFVTGVVMNTAYVSTSNAGGG
ncbi:hypothetical protein CALCODRAFT_500392 [Calocera cornea HHB12733]|uniref:Uncharacterized protein n=1 Tax=Calocera cornea HHB12733 TaxID=1353952 RepID=A0A165E402_9BASI|nr:hypothetical protein CALCODRAFT_500392 [Calocera cornea HHB12733]